MKKGARTTVAVVSAAVNGVRKRTLIGRTPAVRVLTYHRFGDARRDPFCVDATAFEEHIRWLAEHRLAISLDELEAFLRGDRMLPDGAVLVTIDDGCPSLYTRALPVLRRHGIPAVAFVPAGEIVAAGRHSTPTIDEPAAARITVEDLIALARAGVAIGSHAWDHRSLGTMSQEDVRDQLVRSRKKLEDLTGAPVTAFAYPFGTRADYDDRTRGLLQATGYTLAFTSQHGAIRHGMDALTLPRIKIEGGEPFWMFRLLSEGALDSWSFVDRTMWRLQASGG